MSRELDDIEGGRWEVAGDCVRNKFELTYFGSDSANVVFYVSYA